MLLVANCLTGLVALLQTYFLVVEMFLWQTPRVTRAFGMTREFAAASAVLAKNQGLYNGFLAAGLAWGLVTADPVFALSIKSFFLACVLAAGIYGGATANRRIIFVQALPALLALIFVHLGRAG